jgi:hypothetical protein
MITPELMMASLMSLFFVTSCNSQRTVRLLRPTCETPSLPLYLILTLLAHRAAVKRTWAMYVGVGDFETQVMDIVMYQQVPLSLSLS